ncbi:MAG: hypothetical protein NC099_00630 [Corallococcus sp.]|nr:hypothetical protein [Corallococcus sp.]
MNAFNLLAGIFYPWQTTVIAVVSLVIAGFIVLNVYFAFKFRIAAERKMFDDELQGKRDALMARLNYLYAGGEADKHDWMFFLNSEDDEEETAATETVAAEEGKQPMNTVLLRVDDLQPRVRLKLGMRAKRFDGKCFYVRYRFGFDAKLRFADDETKERYVQIMDNFRSYEGVSIEKSFASQRVMLGKTMLASVTFAGQRMCVGFAVEPTEEYTTGQYRGEDKSDKKRFAKTPVVVRILSGENKTEAVRRLFAKIAEKNGIVRGETKKYVYDLDVRTQEQLIVSGAVKVIIVADAPNETATANAAQTAQVAAE